jgi:hypothetical protein
MPTGLYITYKVDNFYKGTAICLKPLHNSKYVVFKKEISNVSFCRWQLMKANKTNTRRHWIDYYAKKIIFVLYHTRVLVDTNMQGLV